MKTKPNVVTRRAGAKDCAWIATASLLRAAALVSVLAPMSLLTSCGKAPAPAATEVVALERSALPSDPNDAAWADAPTFAAALIVQDMVEPRLMNASTTQVRVQAITDGRQIAFRLAWSDSTNNDLPGAARFADACAVQLPVAQGPDLPAPQMGEAGRRVEITYWSAFWQAAVNGRPDSISALYPDARVDHYPFEAAALAPGSEEQRAMELRYAPARALGNPMARPLPGEAPVQDLIAEGPGTLTPAPVTRSRGAAKWAGGEWRVVLTRALPWTISPSERSQVAFAVWDGAHQEAGARKMRSVWIPLSVQGPA
ncbi:MAG: ethylbenzene dehydrogenase-related protein [bacterium]